MATDKKIIIVSCSGASNTGSLSDGAARSICRQDPERYDMLCLPAYSLRKAPSIKKLNEAGSIAVIEGCPLRCASEILKQGGITPSLVVEVVQDYGVKKVMIPKCDPKDIERIAADIRVKLKRSEHGEIVHQQRSLHQVQEMCQHLSEQCTRDGS